MIKDLYKETWKELEAGAKVKDHPFKICSLASIEASLPKQRMVVLREITPQQTLLFYTDSRSSKIQHFENDPGAGALFYNNVTRLQLSIKGKIEVHTNTEVWEEHRLKIEGRAVNDYNTKYAPGKKIKNPLAVSRTTQLHFAVLELKPTSIEYLKLRDEPNRLRALFSKTEDNEDWNMTFLVP